MAFDIHGKVILITGANRGIGRALVDSFIEHGAAKIYAAVRTLDSAGPLIEDHGDKVVPLHIDLAVPQSISAAAETASDVEVVVNNAGVLMNSSPLDENAISSIDFEMDINVKGLIHMAQALTGVQFSGFNSLVEYEQDLAAFGFPPLLPYLDAGDLAGLHRQCQLFDQRLQSFLTERSVPLNNFGALDELEVYLKDVTKSLKS